MATLHSTIYDLLIVGGGINGAGVAADAAGRGLSVFLCEQGDLAGATSSASSKLIHGGLRYLEHKEFRLVKEALAEREILLKIAPHLVQPLRFILPHRSHLRPAWMLRMGLFLYDHMAKRDVIEGSKQVRFTANSPLKPEIRKGFMYSDCWVDDARLVLANAQSARQNGAVIRTQTRCTGARRVPEHNIWVVDLEDNLTGQKFQVSSRCVVNAAGPWVRTLFDSAFQIPSPRGVRLIKGSHIIVPRFQDWPGAFILQNTDKRIVFVLPFQDDFHLIGTTDKHYIGDPSKVSIDQEEIDYLVNVVNDHFVVKLNAHDVVRTYSGVRALCDDESEDPSAMTRDYTLEVSDHQGQMPLLSIFGGKITTYRKLSESVMARLAPWYPKMGASRTATTPLPGSSRAFKSLHDIQAMLTDLYPEMPENLIRRFARSYGINSLKILGNASTLVDLGRDFGAQLTKAEVDYLVKEEWAVNVDDILWRRSKLGLRLTLEQVGALEAYLCEHTSTKT